MLLFALLFLTAALPLALPFSAPPSRFVSTRHHSISQHDGTISTCSSFGKKCISHSLTATASSYTNIIQHLNIHRYRRCSSSILQATDDNDNENNNQDNPEQDKFQSDDALFQDSIASGNNDGVTLSDSSLIYNQDDQFDDTDVDITEDDPYAQTAPSEFKESADDNEDDEEEPVIVISDDGKSIASAVARGSRELNTSPLDWGGALSTLRSRVSDIESGKSTNPSTALFRTITRERPNEAIGRFVREANPEVVAAMTGAVSSLLGSLSNPASGVEMIVQASSEKLGNLCFQLMMTGYMFRNAEYVLALKSLMDIKGLGATLEEYKAAFQRIDTDGSGYLEVDEIEALLADVYEGSPPAFEVQTFMDFFDSNNDGRISWEEFEKGFGVVSNMSEAKSSEQIVNGFSLPASNDEEDDDDGIGDLMGEPAISGTIKVELEDGKIIEVDAQEYVDELKQQALELKRELAQEKGIDPKEMGIQDSADGNLPLPSPGSPGNIASYIASLQGDVKSLTEGISPEVVDSMKMLIDFVLETADKKKEVELPGSALQQLALWQLVIGYRLRETEATNSWKDMLK